MTRAPTPSERATARAIIAAARAAAAPIPGAAEMNEQMWGQADDRP